MIPTAFLQAWSVKSPWPDLRQVEQDLIGQVPALSEHFFNIDVTKFQR